MTRLGACRNVSGGMIRRALFLLLCFLPLAGCSGGSKARIDDCLAALTALEPGISTLFIDRIGTKSDGIAILYRRDNDFSPGRIQCVFEEGLTLSGARRRLEEDGDKRNGAAILVEEVVGDRVRGQLRQVRSGLEWILALLSKDEGPEPELRLVAPAPPKKKSVAKAKAKK